MSTARFVLRSVLLLAVIAACLAAPQKKNPNDIISNSVIPESENLAKQVSPDTTSDADSNSDKNPSYSDYISSIFQIPISILNAVRDLFTGGARKA